MNKNFLTGDDLVQTVAQYFKQDYRERGKVKWNGFFLSDHTAKLKQKAQFEQGAETATWQEALSMEQIQEQVRLAFERNKPLSLQEAQVDQDNRIPMIQIGRVSGFYLDGFYFDDLPVDWETVRFAEVHHGK
ncbi:hypothetical protein [Fructobacillus parabroussonetiae]|uniref:DNA-directed RNA polymerase beta subunit n=1 Tax=Fructobacillus parabroussonetiae TaxID=2713174 RepID=A0ABS5QWB5_9LACO|nr:hypothetical protein [Fructobacillus parabroussonetiae]MBS9337495.1 hypothetical protein [Fructobacillus parabroussonetiae]